MMFATRMGACAGRPTRLDASGGDRLRRRTPPRALATGRRLMVLHKGRFITMPENITATFIDFNPGTDQHEISLAHDARAHLGEGGTDIVALFIPLDPPGAPVSVTVRVADFNAGAANHTTW